MQLDKAMRSLLFLVALASIARCDGSPVQSAGRPKRPDIEPGRTEFTDQELRDAVYSSSKYPSSFYTEDFAGATPYYVNTVSITPPKERRPASAELCSDKQGQARTWVETSNERMSVRRSITSESQTEKYFEFLSCAPGTRGVDCVRLRVHKCNYLDRNQYDPSAKGPVLGTLNQRPITGARVRELAEYLYFLKTYNMFGSAALSSISSQDDSAFVQTIHGTSVVGGDWGMHDQVTLCRYEYRVNRLTGEIHLRREDLRTINGHYHPPLR